MLLSQAVVLAMPGVPGIYFHSLVGSRNYLEGVARTGVNRSINREKLELNDLKRDLADPDHLRSRIFHFLRDLIRVRTRQAAFDPCGPFAFPETIAGVFAIQRFSRDRSEQVLALHNFTGRARRFPLPAGWPAQPYDLVAGETLAAETNPGDGNFAKNPEASGGLNPGANFAELGPYQIRWLIRSR
jgi:sucrose phosphorylase